MLDFHSRENNLHGARLLVDPENGVRQPETLKGTLRTGFVGILCGLAGAYWTGSLVAGILQGIEPFDALTCGSVAAAVVIISLGSSYIPARRIIRLDPARVLRSD